jgi:hypothetical protein
MLRLSIWLINPWLSLWALQEKEARLKMQSVESRKKLLDDIAQEECKKVSININPPPCSRYTFCRFTTAG